MGVLSLVPDAINQAIQSHLRQDSWVSTILGLGGAQDKTLGTTFRRSPILTPQQSIDLFTSNDLARLICEVKPRTALRRGFTVNITSQDEAGQELADEREAELAMRLEELQALQSITEAAIWGLCTGAGAILMGIDDGLQPDEPVRMDANGNPQGIRRVNYLKVYDRRRLQIIGFDLDPMSEHFGCPSLYRVQAWEGNTAHFVDVHASRLILLPGVLTADQEKIANQGFDHSILQACYDVLAEFGVGWKAATYLLTDSSQAVYAVKGLNNILASEAGESSLQARMRVTEMSRSIARALVIDADGEKFEKVATSFTGVPDLLDRLSNRLAAAARIPVSILMGQAPAGLNATGQADLETFYGEVQAWQRDVAKPAIRELARILLAEDGAQEPDVWRVEFPPVNPSYDVDQATLRKSVAETDKLYFDMGVASSDEIALSRFSNGWSPDTTIDLEMRRERMGMTQQSEAPPEPGDQPGTEGTTAGTTEAGQQIPTTPIANTAMNGAQITSLLEVIGSIANGQIPRDTGIAVLTVGFNISPEDADRLLGPVGRGFTPAPAAAPPSPAAPAPTVPQP